MSAVGGDILDGIGSSGDKFYQTPEGYYVYAGRTDDMLKVSGIYVSPYRYARWVEFVAELPKTATGKIQRFKPRTINERC